MSHAAGRDAWNHTAAILCLIANTSGSSDRSDGFTVEEFHPYHQTDRTPEGVPDPVDYLERHGF
jgi:hypothetical protein